MINIGKRASCTHLRPIPGIYKITNNKNGMAYVGQSSNVMYRLLNHITHLDGGTHIMKKLQGDWDKYGAESFEFEILERVDDKGMRLDRERSIVIQMARDDEGCYNDSYHRIRRQIRSSEDRAREYGY